MFVMKSFTYPPLTADSLASRLNRYGFWTRKKLDFAVAKNAIWAAKRVARPRSNKAVPQTIRGVLPTSTNTHLLDQMYHFQPILEHLPNLWSELLLADPDPPFKIKMNLLKSLVETTGRSKDETIRALAAVLQTELMHGNYLNGIPIVALVPLKSHFSVIAQPLMCTGLATTSLALWASAPIIGTGLFIFWVGLALNSLRLPVFPRVSWSAWRQKGRIAQLRRADQLKIANALVTAFEELESVTVTNYHRRAHEVDDVYLKEEEKRLLSALRKLGIEIKSSDREASALYADYWSHHSLRWNSVEWLEPDQDPAELELGDKREKRHQE